MPRKQRVGALGFTQKLVAVPISRWFLRASGSANRPIMYEVEDTCAELNAVTQAFASIQQELRTLLSLSEQTSLPRYHDLDAGQQAYSGGKSAWNVFMLECFGERPPSAASLCPQTISAVNQVPNRLQAFFSILEPGKSIPVHTGPYSVYLRYHLGLIVPEDSPPALVLNDQRFFWQEGKGMLFDDSWPHGVENSSSDIRAVLVIDIRRPLPKHLDILNRLITGLGGRLTYGRRVAARAERFAAALLAQKQGS